MLNNNVQINAGDTFINEHNGGQKVTVTTTKLNGIDGLIGYKLHEALRFSSVDTSHCDEEIFRNTFSLKAD